MAKRVIEDMRYGYFNKKPIPEFCPLCGRQLEHWQWDSGSTVYPSLVCYGGKGRFRVALRNRMGIGLDPLAAHYEAKVPSYEMPISHVFDPRTGKATKE